MSKIRVFFLTLILLGLSYFLINSITSHRPSELDHPSETTSQPVGQANMGSGGGEMELVDGVYYGEHHEPF